MKSNREKASWQNESLFARGIRKILGSQSATENQYRQNEETLRNEIADLRRLIELLSDANTEKDKEISRLKLENELLVDKLNEFNSLAYEQRIKVPLFEQILPDPSGGQVISSEIVDNNTPCKLAGMQEVGLQIIEHKDAKEIAEPEKKENNWRDLQIAQTKAEIEESRKWHQKQLAARNDAATIAAAWEVGGDAMKAPPKGKGLNWSDNRPYDLD